MTQLSEQTLFADRYLFQRLLGRGGFSEVWLAIDKMTGLEIAVKVYAPGQGMDTHGMNDFCKELSQVYNLNHTNLVKPQHVDNWEGMPYLVMTYCPQGSCHRMIGTMTEEQIWKMLHDVASGLAYLHDQGIIHQDIKPDNILLDPLGNYVISDFGISIQSRSTLRKSMNIATGSGTTAYMGPERFSKDPTPIKASDIWSLGATAYELLTGNAPFGEIGGGLQKSGADIPTIKQNISPALRQTIALMLSENPWDRPTATVLAGWAENPDMIEESFLKITPQSVDMNPVGGEQIITIKSQEPWKFFYDENCKWLKVEKQGDNTLNIAYAQNESGQDRSVVINIIAGARAGAVNLVQKSIPKRSKKPLLIIGVLCLIIGLALGYQYGIVLPRKINKLRAIYTEETSRSTAFIASMSYKDNEKKLLGPVHGIAKIQELERIKHFPKTKLEPQAYLLQSAYLDSLQSIQARLDIEIAKEKRYLSKGEETTWLKKLNSKRSVVENLISQFEQGYTVQEISESLKTSKQ